MTDAGWTSGTNVTQRGSGLAVVSFDVMKPQHRAGAVRRLTHMALSGSADDIAAGKYWYPEGHDEMRSMASDYESDLDTAAGVTTVLSGGSDWSQSNKKMAAQALQLHPRHWDQIANEHASEVARVAGLRQSGHLAITARASRTTGVDQMLRAEAPALRVTTNDQLLKARRMIHGGGAGAGPEHPLDVFSRATSPKYRAFYGGLVDPRHRRVEVPVDYRAADINRNEMRPRNWGGRGIDFGVPKRGQTTTPYAEHEGIIGHVGEALRQLGGRKFAGVTSPLGAQAYLWSLGKSYEFGHPEAKESKQRPGEMFSGPPRRGQRYTTRTGSWAPYE